MYKIILFDLDNTLFDFDVSEEYAINKLFDEYNISKDKIAIYRRINHKYWNLLEQGKMKRDDIVIKRFYYFFIEIGCPKSLLEAKEVNEKYLRLLEDKTGLMPHAMEVLNILKNKAKLYIITNGIKRIQNARISRVPGFRELFEKIYVSSDVGYSKPDIRFAEDVLNEIEYTSKKEILIVGDSESSDIKLGSNTGIDCVWFNPQNKKTDLDIIASISDLRELVNIVEKTH